MSSLGDRKLTVVLLIIDVAKNAESMGARAWRVATPDELRQALREAHEERRSCVIVVETEPYRRLSDSGVWWDVATAEASNDPVTQELRQVYEEGRRLQRFYY